MRDGALLPEDQYYLVGLRPAQGGIGSRILRDEIVEHFAIHKSRNDQSRIHMIASICAEGIKGRS